jgi:hypothetical protein
MHRFTLSVLATVIYLLVGSLTTQARDNVANWTCQEIVTADAKFTAKTALFDVWLQGYVGGIYAASTLDNRLGIMSPAKFAGVELYVLAYCANADARSERVIEAATNTIAFMVNVQPGRTVEFAIPDVSGH